MSINWSFYPTLEMVKSVNSEVAATLPSSYDGTVENRSLAEALIATLGRKSFDEIEQSAPLDFVSPYGMQPGGPVYAELAYRYAIDTNDAVLFWDFLSLNEGKRLPVSTFYYICSLLSVFSGQRIMNVFMMISAIHKQQKTEGYAVDKIQLPTVATITSIDEMSRILREEGAPVEARKLWIASLTFPPSEVIRLMEEGLPLERAVQLYDLGFTTIDEIKSNINSIPDSWMDALFGDMEDDSWIDNL